MLYYPRKTKDHEVSETDYLKVGNDISSQEPGLRLKRFPSIWDEKVKVKLSLLEGILDRYVHFEGTWRSYRSF